MTTATQPSSATDSAKVLLVVDDEFLIRWSLRTRLAAAGYRVLEAATLAEAREALDRGVDLVLLDVLLPDGNGLDLLAELQKTAVHPPTILISAHATAEVAARAKAQGAFDFVHKPFDLDAIAALVASALQTGAA
jgi:DNA-binding NtrC family response regulator